MIRKTFVQSNTCNTSQANRRNNPKLGRLLRRAENNKCERKIGRKQGWQGKGKLALWQKNPASIMIFNIKI